MQGNTVLMSVPLHISLFCSYSNQLNNPDVRIAGCSILGNNSNELFITFLHGEVDT